MGTEWVRGGRGRNGPSALEAKPRGRFSINESRGGIMVWCSDCLYDGVDRRRRRAVTIGFNACLWVAGYYAAFGMKIRLCLKWCDTCLMGLPQLEGGKAKQPKG